MKKARQPPTTPKPRAAADALWKQAEQYTLNRKFDSMLNKKPTGSASQALKRLRYVSSRTPRPLQQVLTPAPFADTK